MRKTSVVVAFLLLSIPAMQASKPKVDPSQYTLTAQVVGSGSNHNISVLIDGEQMELQVRGVVSGTLALGNYRARAIPDSDEPREHAAYDIWRRYEFLMPDGVTRQFDLIALGTPVN